MRTWVAALLLLAASPLAAECTASTWFRDSKVALSCPIENPESVRLSIPWDRTYMATDQDRRLQALREKRGEIILKVDYLAEDLADETFTVEPGENDLINSLQIVVDLPFRILGDRKAIRTLSVVFPPESLFCEGSLVDEETTLEIQVTDANGAQPVVSCIAVEGNEASRPLDWKIDLAPVDDDAEDDPGVGVDFSFEKNWGYNLQLNRDNRSWATNIWGLKIDGSGATNDADFHDSVTADFSWSWNRTFLDLGDKPFKKRFTSTWASLFARPETTFETDHRDYVFGARIEALANLKNLIGTNVGTGTRPYLALGFETVDPDKREDGTIPDNYERATADFLWKFSPFERVRVEIDWEAKYIVDKDDLAALELDDRLQDKLDLSVALDVSGQREFMPFLKYTRGAEAPKFEVVEEILFGLVWDRLFQGEAPQ